MGGSRPNDLPEAARPRLRRGSVCAVWHAADRADHGVSSRPLADEPRRQRPQTREAESRMGGADGGATGTRPAALRKSGRAYDLPKDLLRGDGDGSADGVSVWQGQLWPVCRRGEAGAARVCQPQLGAGGTARENDRASGWATIREGSRKV